MAEEEEEAERGPGRIANIDEKKVPKEINKASAVRISENRVAGKYALNGSKIYIIANLI